MPRPPRMHVPGRLYHVMARGNGGQAIVSNLADWPKLLDVITGVKETSDFMLYAYCLMTNHFHLLLGIGDDPLSHIMHRVQTTWAKRFNIARRRRGHVFQDRFKSRPCDNDEYFIWLLRYIHLNPVKAHLVQCPEDWRWSSFRQYLGQEEGIAETEWPLSLFGPQPVQSFRNFVGQDLPEGNVEPLELSDSHAPHTLAVERRKNASHEPADIKELAGQIAAAAGVDVIALFGPSRARHLCAARRKLVAQALARGHRACDLAQAMGVSPTAVSQMARTREAEH